MFYEKHVAKARQRQYLDTYPFVARPYADMRPRAIARDIAAGTLVMTPVEAAERQRKRSCPGHYMRPLAGTIA